MDAVLGSLADPGDDPRTASGRLTYANDAAVRELGFGSQSDLLERGPEALLEEQIVTDESRRAAGVGPDALDPRAARRGARAIDATDCRSATGRGAVAGLKSTPLRDPQGNLEAAVTIHRGHQRQQARRAPDELPRAHERRSLLVARLRRDLAQRRLARRPRDRGLVRGGSSERAGRAPAGGRRASRPGEARARRATARLRESRIPRPEPEGSGGLLRTGEPQLFEEIPQETLEAAARDEEHLRLIQQLGMRSGLVVPLRTGVRIVGAMTLVNSESGRRFTEEDVRFAEQIAIRAAVAVENSRLYTQRSQIAMTLQQSLLPEALPRIDGWEIASLYRPARAGRRRRSGRRFLRRVRHRARLGHADRRCHRQRSRGGGDDLAGPPWRAIRRRGEPPPGTDPLAPRRRASPAAEPCRCAARCACGSR